MHGLNTIRRLNALAAAHTEADRKAVAGLSDGALATVTQHGLSRDTRETIRHLETRNPFTGEARPRATASAEVADFLDPSGALQRAGLLEVR